MGYSARYHAASLAAVFIALAIGILIGVGLGDNVISGTRKDLEQSLKSDLADARGRADALQAQLAQERELDAETFPALVGGLLRGKRVAVVALGGLPDNLMRDVESVVAPGSPTGAKLGEVAVVREPPDLRALAAASARRIPPRRLAGDPSRLTALSRRAGTALVQGGPALRRYRDALLARVSGRPRRVGAVIVVRARPADLGQRQAAAADRLDAGIVAGLRAAGRVPVVGVERSDSDPSSIAFFQSAEVGATVDSVDLPSGRVALAYTLHGSRGSFGVKASADRLLPELRRRVARAAPRPAAP